MAEETRGAVELLDLEEVEKLASYYGGKRKWAKLIVDKYFPEGASSVLDPTAGMAWVPLEALRRGMTVYLNEASPVAFTFVRGLLKGEPVDVEKFTDIKPSSGRMSKGDIYGTAPREVAGHLDSLAIKANRTEGPRGFWAQALVANILTWGSGGHLGTWTAYDDPRWKPAMTWKGTRGILHRAHEAMVKLKEGLKGKSILSHGDVRNFKWHDVDVVFLDPPYFGSGMTDYSKQYKNINSVLLQSDEPVRFEDLTEDDFFKLVLPKALKHSKRVVLCYPAKRHIGLRLGKLGLIFRSAMLPKKLTGATISSNRAEGGALDSNTRVYIIDGARKAGVKKASTKAWLLGTLGEGIPVNESDPQSIEAAKLGSNFPHRAEPSFLIDDGRARVLIDLGGALAHELDTIKPDAVIVTRGEGLAGLAGYKDSGAEAVVFVPEFVKHEKLIPGKKLRLYEPGDKIRIPGLPDFMTFDTGDGVGIHYKEFVYTPHVKKLGGFDAHLKQHGEGGVGTVWITDGLGLGPHRGKTGEPRVKGHPTLKDILDTAKRTGVKRVILTNIGRHGLGSEDFRTRIRDLSRDSGVSVSVGEDELDLREVKLSSDGESLFVKDAYNPRRVNDAQLSDDFRLVAAKYSTLKGGGATEFEDEEELLAFGEWVVREILRRDKTTFHFKTMKPRSRELIRKLLRRIVMTGVQFTDEDARTLSSGKSVAYIRKDGVKFEGFNYIISADDRLAYGFIRFHPPKKRGDEYSYEIRDLIPFDEPISVDLRGVKKNATVEVSLADDEYDLDYYSGKSGLDAAYVSELGAVLAEAQGDDYLDLGCGEGRALCVLAESGYKVLGVDKSKAAVEICEEAGLPVKRGDAANLSDLDDGSFDTVFSTHLLEHVADPEAVLDESIRLARKRTIHLVPLGKRQDKTHKRSFMSLDDVRALAERTYGSKAIRRGPGNTALIIIDRETAPQGRVVDLMDDLVVVPGYVSLTGSWVKRDLSEEDSPPDVDLVIRDSERDEGLELKVRNQLPSDLKTQAHFIYNAKGPHDDNVPLYDLVLVRRKPERCDIEKRALKPLTVFQPLKTGRGYTLQEFFDIETFYERWAKAYLDEGTPLDVEVKYSGWRCCRGNVKILTDRGLLAIRYIKEGDYVIGSSGHFRKVNKVMARDYKKGDEIIKITPWGSLPFEITTDHRVLTNKRGWIMAGELTKQDRLIVPKPKLKKGKAPQTINLENDEGYKKVINLDSELFYFLGRWVGDGSGNPAYKGWHNRRIDIVFNANDKRGKNKIKSIIEKKLNCKVHEQKHSTSDCIALWWKDFAFCDWLCRNFRLINRTSISNTSRFKRDKTLPPWFDYISKEMFESFMKGLMDSDGHKNILTTAYGSLAGAIWRQYLGRSKRCNLVTGFATATKGGKYYRYYRLTFATRKWDWLEKKNHYEVKIKNINKIKIPPSEKSQEKLYDITVEKDHSMLTGAVIHNCIGQLDDKDRTLIYFEDSKKDRSDQFPDLRDELKSIGGRVILDMDLGAVTDEGNVMARKDLAYWGGKETVPLHFKTPGGEEGSLLAHVFDILYYKGEDLHGKPWTERREILERLFAKTDFKIMKLSDIRVVKKKSDLFDAIKRAAKTEGSEGAVIKVTTSDYPLTGQTPAWSKIKSVLELKVVVLDRVPVKGSPSTWNYVVGYQADGETLKLGKTFNTKVDAKTGAILTISAEEVIPKFNEDKKRWEVSVVVPRVRDIELGRSTPDKAEDVIRRAGKAGVLQLTDETRDRLKKEGLVTKALREGGLSFEEGQTGEGVIQTHERGLSKDQVEFTTSLGWEPTRPSGEDYRILNGLVSGDWRGAVEEAAEGKSGKLTTLLKKVERENLTRPQRRALAKVDLVSAHVDFRLRPGKEPWWEGGEFFTPGNQFAVNKIKAIADGDLPSTTKVLGNFKVGREDEEGKPVKVKGQELIRGPIAWLKIGERSPAIFAPGEIGASSEAFGRMTVRDKIKWTAGVQDKHFKEFWLDGKTLKGRWIFQFVPVTLIEGAKRAWMASRPKDQRMKSEKARDMIGQD